MSLGEKTPDQSPSRAAQIQELQRGPLTKQLVCSRIERGMDRIVVDRTSRMLMIVGRYRHGMRGLDAVQGLHPKAVLIGRFPRRILSQLSIRLLLTRAERVIHPLNQAKEKLSCPGGALLQEMNFEPSVQTIDGPDEPMS